MHRVVEQPVGICQLDDATIVRFGSKADINAALIDVRFTPKSGHCETLLGCPLCAKSRLMMQNSN